MGYSRNFQTKASPCLALMGIAHVSEGRAKEMGIEVRSRAAGPNAVWVELEFETEAELKSFSHVSLEIREGKKLLVGYAALRERRSDSGTVVVSFMASRAYLDRITLRIVVGAARSMAGHDLRVKDFVDLRKAR